MLNDMENNAAISTFSLCEFTHLMNQLFVFFLCSKAFLSAFASCCPVLYILSLFFSPFSVWHCWEKNGLVILKRRLWRNAVSDEMRAVIASLKECSRNILWQSLKYRQGCQGIFSPWVRLKSLVHSTDPGGQLCYRRGHITKTELLRFHIISESLKLHY